MRTVRCTSSLMRFILTKDRAADRLERVDEETSKVRLRADIRSARAARARRADHAEAAPGPSSRVADSVWALIESSWTGEDMSAHSLLAYAALPGEPSLDPALERFLARGGTVFLPVVTAVGRALQFGRVTESMAALQPQGRWGIREPQVGPGTSELLSGEQLLSAEVALDLAFVPALGFGVEGARLGNGGGFYDRTFGPLGEAPVADRDLPVYGVCFAEELGLPGLAAEEWDLRIDAAVTDEGVHRF